MNTTNIAANTASLPGTASNPAAPQSREKFPCDEPENFSAFPENQRLMPENEPEKNLKIQVYDEGICVYDEGIARPWQTSHPTGSTPPFPSL